MESVEESRVLGEILDKENLRKTYRAMREISQMRDGFMTLVAGGKRLAGARGIGAAQVKKHIAMLEKLGLVIVRAPVSTGEKETNTYIFPPLDHDLIAKVAACRIDYHPWRYGELEHMPHVTFVDGDGQDIPKEILARDRARDEKRERILLGLDPVPIKRCRG